MKLETIIVDDLEKGDYFELGFSPHYKREDYPKVLKITEHDGWFTIHLENQEAKRLKAGDECRALRMKSLQHDLSEVLINYLPHFTDNGSIIISLIKGICLL